MLRWISFIGAVIVFAAVATYLSTSVSNSTRGPVLVGVVEGKGPHPKVEIAEPLVYDFGILPQQTKKTRTWHIKNVGDGDLEMWMKSSTCSCTIAKLVTKEGEETKKVIVKPMESTTIDLEFETRQPQSPDYSKGAVIGTNDPARQSFGLTVKGKVYPPVLVYPPEMINFPAINNEETTKATVAVFSLDRPETKVTKSSTSLPQLMGAKVTPLTDDDRKHLNVKSGGFRVDLEIKPGMSLGRFQEELVLDTDHPLQPQVKITVTGNAAGPIGVIPERVRMTDVKGSKGAVHNMTVLVRGNRETNFDVVEKPEKLDVKITPDPKQKGRYQLSVIVRPGTPPGAVEGDIVIKTDHPRARELRIPATVLISGGP